MARAAGAPSRPPVAGGRLILVEDHPVLRQRFTGQLKEAGLDVAAAVGTLRDGYEAVLELRPDVAVIDSRLPDGRGVELCRKIHGAVPYVILLLHAGVANAVEEREALDAGVAAIVPKAIRGRGLVTAVLLNVRRR